MLNKQFYFRVMGGVCMCARKSFQDFLPLQDLYHIFLNKSSLQLQSNSKEHQPNKVLFFQIEFGRGNFLFGLFSFCLVHFLLIYLLAFTFFSFSYFFLYPYFIKLISFMETKNLGIDHFLLRFTQEVCSFITQVVFGGILDLWLYYGM